MLPYAETENCVACLKKLSDDERRYYGYRCNACEGILSQRLADWRHGKGDRELDSLFMNGEKE